MYAIVSHDRYIFCYIAYFACDLMHLFRLKGRDSTLRVEGGFKRVKRVDQPVGRGRCHWYLGEAHCASNPFAVQPPGSGALGPWDVNIGTGLNQSKGPFLCRKSCSEHGFEGFWARSEL